MEEDEVREQSNENINHDFELEYPESEDLEKGLKSRSKRQKLSTPKRSKKLAKQEDCVDNNVVDKIDVDKFGIDDQTQLEGRKNLSILLTKICSIPNENAVGSNFDILNGKPPSFYSLSPGKSKLGLVLTCSLK